MKNQERKRCTECCKTLVNSSKFTVLLYLSDTDGFYYKELPQGHKSLGQFPFDKTCAHMYLTALQEA